MNLLENSSQNIIRITSYNVCYTKLLRIKLYYAEIDITERKDIAGLDAENEDIKVIALKREEALKLLDSGRLNNGAVLIAMQWFALNQNKIINQWNNK